MLIANYLVSGKIEIKIRGKLDHIDRVTLARLGPGLYCVKSGHWTLDNPGMFSYIPLIREVLMDYHKQIKLPMEEQ